jgi:hypothetical protein
MAQRRNYPSVTPFGRATSPFVLRKNGEGLTTYRPVSGSNDGIARLISALP